MNFNIGAEDVGIAVLQELWVRVTLQAKELSSETRDVALEKNRFQEFSGSISRLTVLLRALDPVQLEAAPGAEFIKATLNKLSSLLQRGSEIIKDCKSGSRLRILLQSVSVLGKMQDLSREIAATISSLQLTNLGIGLNVECAARDLVQELSSIEFRSSIVTETIAAEIENSMTRSGRNRDNAVKLLEKIAEAVGASSSTDLVLNEVEVLKKEKEEVEAEKNRAEALQLSQLLQLLHSTEIIERPRDEDLDDSSSHRHYPIDSFLCPISNEMMKDPVAILCGHSFERKAVEEHFEKGGKICPTCKEELRSTDVTPNIALRGSIEEWRRRDMELRFQSAERGINSDDCCMQSRALEDMQYLMEMPQYAAKAANKNLVPKLVGFLKDGSDNVSAVLKCLTAVARHCEEHKEAMVEAGGLRPIMKQLYKVDAAAMLLLELSSRETIAEKIGNTKNSIPLLVSMLNHGASDAADKARGILQNLSFNTHFVVKMAESGYLQPFVSRFNHAPQETRTLMAAALVPMLLKETGVAELKNEQFMHNLIHMLSLNSPASRSACLKATKKLTAYPELVMLLMADLVTVPLLLPLIFYERSEEAAEILAELVKSSENHHFEAFQGLKELQSEHNVGLFLQHLLSSSDPQPKVKFLQLLVELAHKSEPARNLMRLNRNAVIHLFSCVTEDHGLVRKWAMKLIHSVSENHPDGVPLPASLEKYRIVNKLSDILTSYFLNIEEGSLAAGIISELPKDDMAIDDILCRSEALKAIREVICGTNTEINHIGSTKPLLENALAALLRYTDPSKPDLQRQVSRLELYPSLVRVLSTGSSLAKQRTATAIADLSRSGSALLSDATEADESMPYSPFANVFTKLSRWCSSESEIGDLCSVHGKACSSKDVFCLIRADAVRPLLQSLSDTEGGVQEAALMALETILEDPRTISRATAAIIDSNGIVATLLVMEKGSLAAKLKALELLEKMLSPAHRSDPCFRRVEGVLVQLLHDEALRKKAALVLRQMDVIPHQSSYF